MATKAQIAAAAKTAAAKKGKPAAVAAAPAPAAVAAVSALPAVASAPVAEVNLQHLSHIVSETLKEPHYCYTPSEVNAPLLALGLVEVRPDMVNAEGNQVTRASTAGVAYVNAKSSPFPAAAPVAAPSPFGAVAQTETIAAGDVGTLTLTAAKSVRTVTKPPEGGFKVVMNIPVPPIQRGFGAPKAAVYPFASTPVGGSFFVPATDARPNPAKALASTVNSAMARFAVDVTDPATGVVAKQKTKVFALRHIDDGAQWGFPGVKGAGVFRTQ